MRAPLILGASLLAALLGAGCGTERTDASTTTVAIRRHTVSGLRVGVVGPLRVHVPGAVSVPGTLRRVADGPLALVVVSGSDAGLAAAADAHPSTHFALVGRSTKRIDRPNVAGLVFRETQAAYLGGVVAGLAVQDVGATDERAAWVGPRLDDVVTAFEGGARRTVPGLVVLRGYATPSVTRCKEAALGAIRRGAGVVMTSRGACANGALAAAREQNAIGLALGDFERPNVLATQAVRDAVAGRYHGGEDVVFDAASGAIGIRRLDPHISAETAAQARAAAQELADGIRSPR